MNYSVSRMDMESEIVGKDDYECTQFDFTNNSIYQKKRVNEEDLIVACEDEFPPDFENLEEYISEDEEEVLSAEFDDSSLEEEQKVPKNDVRVTRVKKYKEKLQ